MKWLILLFGSLLSTLFGCNSKNKPPKVEDWPRFPATDKAEVAVATIPLAEGFRAVSFYIEPDKQSLFVLASREHQNVSKKENGEQRPGKPSILDYRLICLGAQGQLKYQKDILETEWNYGGTFGLLGHELMIQIGDYFLVLEPKTFEIIEKIPVNHGVYLAWKEEEMTRDEFEADYKLKFNLVTNHCISCKWINWNPGGEFFVFVSSPDGKRSVWKPTSTDDVILTELKTRFDAQDVVLNPNVLVKDKFNVEILDDSISLKEVELLSAGTQLDFPNYKSRSVLQYELNLNGNKVHFSTSDMDRHHLRISFSDNLLLSLVDGSVWVMYENDLYRIQ